ncbi:hypothetical protein J1605_007163 [Eschrichtius robustus]|uniref:Uncharacterized protein n=1 Tax=Eschrichtius robustus TaxID=9764 RepID=A0AB34H1M6_ESCRO|nr:hypothetical protein J1605_007163 [Eschrichtius robustus]
MVVQVEHDLQGTLGRPIPVPRVPPPPEALPRPRSGRDPRSSGGRQGHFKGGPGAGAPQLRARSHWRAAGGGRDGLAASSSCGEAAPGPARGQRAMADSIIGPELGQTPEMSGGTATPGAGQYVWGRPGGHCGARASPGRFPGRPGSLLGPHGGRLPTSRTERRPEEGGRLDCVTESPPRALDSRQPKPIFPAPDRWWGDAGARRRRVDIRAGGRIERE